LERLGWEGENPQMVVVPNDDDDDDDQLSEAKISQRFCGYVCVYLQVKREKWRSLYNRPHSWRHADC